MSFPKNENKYQGSKFNLLNNTHTHKNNDTKLKNKKKIKQSPPFQNLQSYIDDS